MRNNLPYDPQNIESILIHKKYIELTEEERGVVMNEITSESEYEALRSTLLKIRSSFAEEETLVPNADIRSSLMASFENKTAQRNNSGWWQSLFPSGKSIFLSPGFQLASIALIVATIGIFYFNFNNDEKGGVAQNQQEIIDTPDKRSKLEEGKKPAPVEQPALAESEETLKSKDKIETTEELFATETRDVAGNVLSNRSENLFSQPSVKQDEIADVTTLALDSISSFSWSDNNTYRGEKQMQTELKFDSQDKLNENKNLGLTEKETLRRDQDRESEKAEVSKAKKSNEEDIAPQKGVPANKNPQIFDLLFTSL